MINVIKTTQKSINVLEIAKLVSTKVAKKPVKKKSAIAKTIKIVVKTKTTNVLTIAKLANIKLAKKQEKMQNVIAKATKKNVRRTVKKRRNIAVVDAQDVLTKILIYRRFRGVAVCHPFLFLVKKNVKFIVW